jgi:malonyl-CoA/methylmalonyl-CoA synthetase
MIFLPKFDLDAVIGLMPEATAMMGVPTFYTRLLDDPPPHRDLTRICGFSSPAARRFWPRRTSVRGRTGHRILERYGMTETNMNTSNPYDGDRRAGTVGFPLPGVELKITDPRDRPRRDAAGRDRPDRGAGPNVFKGYWQMPEKTAAELREDGFFITGDLGRVDADGYVHIVGRNKDLIISGGYNIYPKEIELILDEQPGVKESAVIGVPHPDFGETVLGLIVPQPGEAPEPRRHRRRRRRSARAVQAAQAADPDRGPCRATRWARCRKTSCGTSSRGSSRQWMNERLFPRPASLV